MLLWNIIASVPSSTNSWKLYFDLYMYIHVYSVYIDMQNRQFMKTWSMYFEIYSGFIWYVLASTGKIDEIVDLKIKWYPKVLYKAPLKEKQNFYSKDWNLLDITVHASSRAGWVGCLASNNTLEFTYRKLNLGGVAHPYFCGSM